MRVLFASPAVPWPLDSGGRIRTFKLIEALGKDVEIHLHAVLAHESERAAAEFLAGHCASVHLHDRSTPHPAQRLTSPRRERWFWSQPLHAALASELASGGFDLVHIDELAIARAVPVDTGTPAVLHHHKIDTVLEQRLAPVGVRTQLDLWKLRRLEALAATRFPQQLFCSAEDARVMSSRYPGLSCYVAESGFDPDFFQPGRAAREPERLVFLGTLSYGPNVDALRYLTSELLPSMRRSRPELALEIVGLDPTPEVRAMEAPGVHVVGRVDDVRPHLERASALVAPLRVGGGTRLKLVEALATETPVLTTSVGAEGLAFRDREHLRIADSPRAFVEATLEVLDTPSESKAMAERGRALALEYYTWPILAERVRAHWDAVRAAPISASP